MPAEAKPTADVSDATQRREEPGQRNTGPADDSLLDLVAELIALVRQTWRDRFALAKAEAQLAFGSLLLLLGLVVALAVALILVWVLALIALGYYALQWGLSGGWVVAGLLLAQLLLAWYLLRKIKQVTSWLSFPETRRSFSALQDSSRSALQDSSRPEPRGGSATSSKAAASSQHQGDTSR